MSVPYPQFAQQPQQFAQQPQQFAPQPQQFAPQPFPQQPYPQQPYPMGPQGMPAQPRQPLPQGTLDDFYAQPSGGGGPSISWKDAPVGASVVGVVARDVTSADVRADTDPQGNPKFYRDGRPRFVMVVPLKVQASQTYPEGEASLWVRGQLRDELQRAMSAAGVEGAPKTGDVIQVSFTGMRAARSPGMQPSRQFQVAYAREGDQAPQAAATPVAPAQPPASAQPAPQAPQAAPGMAQLPQAAPAPVQVAPTPQAPAQAPQPVPVPQAEANPAAPALAGMTAEQQALFAKLSGGQA